ncbi:MAG TPA: DUF2924 domain-containing protein [Actinomycetota bacterium]|nr:DUF2924 domain-containing protein [Actinomycetota bacterium]
MSEVHRITERQMRRQPLVSQYLENLSSDVFELYQDVIKRYARGRHGIYALYRNDRLYYVGLAQNMPSRLRTHLRDRHQGLWNRFSIYLTINDGHMRELEALLLRITPTPGNRMKGKFAKAENLRTNLAKEIRSHQQAELDELLGRKPQRRRNTRTPRQNGSIPIRAQYKGVKYRARLRADGTIRYEGEIFSSPSAAGKAVIGRAVNGPAFWKYQRAPGDWVPLKQREASQSARRRRRRTTRPRSRSAA